MSAAAATPQRAMSDVTEHEGAVQAGDSEELRWRPALSLPAQLSIELPLPHFRVSDLLQLKVGLVIPTHWRLSRDVPLRVNGTLIGWGEFEVVGNRLAARVTELI